MYCPKCGKQFDDGARFCKYCGTPAPQAVRPPAGRTETANKNMETPPIQNAPVFVGAGASKPKGRRKPSLQIFLIAIAAIVIAAGAVLVLSGRKTAPINHSYPRPELPDSLRIIDRDSQVYINGQNLITSYDGDRMQLAEDGTMAVEARGRDKILIYRDGAQVSEIPGPVEYFYLSGSGEKIVYGTAAGNSHLWDIATGESMVISDSKRSYGISYDGSVLNMGNGYYSRNGEEPVKSGFSIIWDSAPEGKYIYGSSLYELTSEAGVTSYHAEFGVVINGTNWDMFSSDENESDVPKPIAYSKDYKEVLFSVGDDIYYSSVEEITKGGRNDPYEAQYIGNVKGGMLLPVDVLMCDNVFGNYLDDVVYAWQSGYYGYGYSVSHRTQQSIQNGVFLLLKEQNGARSVSVVRLDDHRLEELLPGITGGICLSADETKLWCVADGRLAFCDLTEKEPAAIYCNAAYVRAYGEDVGISGDRMEDGWPMKTTPIAATSDGGAACFIGDDGTLWMCTPDTVLNPQTITKDAFWLQCSADNEFYLMKGDYSEYIEGNFGDLYLVNTEGVMSYQYSDVVDLYMTKSGVYILVGESYDDMNIMGALYRKNDSDYQLVCEDFSAENIHACRWGERG